MSDRPHDEDFQTWRDEITVEGFTLLVLERDDLRTQVARLTKQCDVARNERDGMVQRRYRWKEAVEERNAAVKELDELCAALFEANEATDNYYAAYTMWLEDAVCWKRDADCLRAALRKYGRHRAGCSASNLCLEDCVCGLAELLAESKE